MAVVEDNAADVDLLRFSLEASGIHVEPRVLSDGEQALRLIDELDSGSRPCPLLFIVDLNLPKRSGREVLQRIRQSSVCRSIPVLVFSSSSAEQDRREAARLGADRYVTKPSDLDEFMKIGEVLRSLLEGR